MKKLLISLFVISLCAGLGFAQNKRKAPPAPLIYKAPAKIDLKEIVAEDKSFSVTFPGAPKTEKRDMEKAFVTISRVYRQGSNSIVSVYEFKNDLEAIKETAFEFYRTSMEKSPQIKIEAERDA